MNDGCLARKENASSSSWANDLALAWRGVWRLDDMLAIEMSRAVEASE
jgi:hypothetical protein